MRINEKKLLDGKIDIKNADLFYGDFQALKNINMQIPEKEITAF
ncbi:MAG TPA: phosphate ABC transporter ATP-binding protein, partial [Clostridia bacterium]|nr:phosphate ABC transporter ATP-binding protein [Clostridia bacterium]